ncbi:MAG: MFS transporter [Flavobacteriales bacterium]|nr:MFS transporter [Flavobacteriales bacterium]
MVTFINRAGTMVIPFLSLYLTSDMGLDLKEVGWIMSSFGAGSVLGSWIGGKLTDRLGFYHIMVGTLLISGIAFILLQLIEGFYPFCIGIFFLTLILDSFRPALFVALRGYARPENRTRAVTLIRLAINLGFSMGPAIGGIIITTLSYAGLFWVDGITCMLAAAILVITLPRRELSELEEKREDTADRSPYKDGSFLLAMLVTVLVSIPFVQYFSTIPLFYKEVHFMSEAQIGLLLGFNGLLIFLAEMPLIQWCEQKKFDLFNILIFSVGLFGLSFIVINIFPSISFLWVGMALMTIGEMLNFPFMNRFVFDRSDNGPPGAYMALFTIAWSVAHIFGHNLGMRSVDNLGYSATWWLCAVCLVIAALFIVILKARVRQEENRQ